MCFLAELPRIVESVRRRRRWSRIYERRVVSGELVNVRRGGGLLVGQQNGGGGLRHMATSRWWKERHRCLTVFYAGFALYGLTIGWLCWSGYFELEPSPADGCVISSTFDYDVRSVSSLPICVACVLAAGREESVM